MRVAINICKHCGTSYMFQASGSYDALDIPKIYQSSEYCPDCQKAIYETLKQIPVKFKEQFIKTDEVTLETLLKWEEEEKLENKKRAKTGMFPIIRQVFPSSYNFERQEHSVEKKIKGRGEHKSKTYFYSYFPSEKENAIINVLKRVCLKTGKSEYVLKRD